MMDRGGDADAVLKKLLASPQFSGASRLRDFLRFLINRAIAGDTDTPEWLIATEIYGRHPDYDPAVDPIVRVEAGRLRAKLRDYYETEGRDDAVQLRLPPESFVPVLEAAPPAADAATPAATSPRMTLRVALIVALAAVTTMAALVPFSRRPSEVRNSIAVLPFSTSGGLEGKDYLGEGLTEQLASQIGRSGKLQVAAARSSEQFHNGGDVRSIGEQLHVDLVLEGSVQFAGERIAIRAKLYDTHSGRQIWSEEFERPAIEVLTLQDEMIAAVGHALQLGAAAGARATTGGTTDSGALDLYMQGRYLFNSRKPENLRKSVQLYNAALARDPRFAQAYAGLAQDYVVLGANDEQDISQTTALAREAVAHALALDSKLPDALLTQAATSPHSDWAALERSYRAAIAANPSDANAHHWYGLNLLATGRFREAEAEIRQAQLLDPLSLHIGANIAVIYYCSRRYQDAVDAARKILVLDRHLPQARLALAKGYEALGRYAEAQEILEDVMRTDHSAGVMADLGHVYAVAGKTARARGMIDALAKLAQTSHVPPHHMAFIETALGRKNEALALLEMSYEQGDAGLAFLKVDPRWDPLRGDPRFQKIVRGMILEQ